MEDPNKRKESEKKIRHPFTVPDNYFSQLSVQIADRVHTEKASYSFWLKYRLQLLVTGSLMILLIALFLIKPMGESADPQEILAAVPDETIQEYLETENISYEEILAFADNDDFLFDAQLPDLSEADESALEEEILY